MVSDPIQVTESVFWYFIHLQEVWKYWGIILPSLSNSLLEADEKTNAEGLGVMYSSLFKDSLVTCFFWFSTKYILQDVID